MSRLGRIGPIALALALVAAACEAAVTPSPLPTASPSPSPTDPPRRPPSPTPPSGPDAYVCTERVALPPIADVIGVAWSPHGRTLAIDRMVVQIGRASCRERV